MKRWSKWIPIAILPCLIYFFLFYKLAEPVYRLWDETRLAISAYEMTKTGALIVTTVDYAPDMWNTKPPMMIWAEALCIKLFGLMEFTTRFPAAFCAALTVLLIFGFVAWISKNAWSGFVAAVVLCTSPGYLFYHGVRFGEYESMLAMFTTAYLICIYLYTESRGEKRNVWLFLFFVFLTGAVLTKGIAGMLLAPAIFIYLLIRGRIVQLILNKYFYAGVTFFVVFALGYYGIRELQNPGFLQAVSNNELSGRFAATLEGHAGPWNHYYNFIRTTGFGAWYWTIPATLLSVWFYPNPKLFRASGFCMLITLLFVITISISKTKLLWYCLPVFPILAIAAGILFNQLSSLATTFIPADKSVLIAVMLAIFSLQPLVEAVNFIVHQSDNPANNDFFATSLFFRKAIAGQKNLNNTIYLSNDYNYGWLLYIYQLNEMGKNIYAPKFFGDCIFKNGDSLIANQADVQQYIENKYNFKIMDNYFGVKEYLVTGIK